MTARFSWIHTALWGNGGATCATDRRRTRYAGGTAESPAPPSATELQRTPPNSPSRPTKPKVSGSNPLGRACGALWWTDDRTLIAEVTAAELEAVVGFVASEPWLAWGASAEPPLPRVRHTIAVPRDYVDWATVQIARIAGRELAATVAQAG
jgi:hypothetical protein